MVVTLYPKIEAARVSSNWDSVRAWQLRLGEESGKCPLRVRTWKNRKRSRALMRLLLIPTKFAFSFHLHYVSIACNVLWSCMKPTFVPRTYAVRKFPGAEWSTSLSSWDGGSSFNELTSWYTKVDHLSLGISYTPCVSRPILDPNGDQRVFTPSAVRSSEAF